MAYLKMDSRLAAIAGRPYLGHKFTNGEEIVHELKCWVCGGWFNYKSSDIPDIAREGRWDYRKRRPKHCNSKSRARQVDVDCAEYMRRHEAYQVKVQNEEKDYHFQLFNRLKKKGLVA